MKEKEKKEERGEKKGKRGNKEGRQYFLTFNEG